MPASYDAEVAELFRDLRAASNLSEDDLAAALATRVDVVQALEQGALYALPPWTETCRVVNAYGALLNLDVRPLLRRIYAQVEAGIVELQPRGVPDLPVMPRSESVDFEFPEGAEPFAPLPASTAPEPPEWPEAQPLTPDRREQPRPPQGRPPQNQPARAYPGQAYPPQQFPGRPQSPPQPHPGQQYAPAPQPGQQYRPPQHPGQPNPRAPQQPQPPRPQAQEPFAPFSNGARPQPTPALPVQTEKPPVSVGERAGNKVPRKGLLKWGVAALIVSGAVFGLWLALGDSSRPPRPAPSGSQSPESSDRVLDPDDPRRRKADRLPTPH